MPVMHTPESAYAKEMVKWEANWSPYGAPGRPFQHHDYPAMMYKAGRVNDGPIGIIDHETAADENARASLESRGFVAGGPGAAVAAYEKQQFAYAELAAARNYEDKGMGEKAKAESQAAEARISEHLPGIPETPIGRRQNKA